MDQQLDESLGLDDGAIGIEFNGEQEVVTTSDCSFDVSNTNFESEIDEEMELGQIRDDHEMETDSQIIGGEEYIHEDSSTHNMPILGGEEEVLADQTQVNLKMNTQANVIQLPDLESIREVIPSELYTPKAVSKVTSLPTSALGQSFSIQTFRVASNSSLKPVSIAPKPITMSSSVKKISLSDLQARPSRILGGELSGRQVVVVPSGGTRLKVVGGVGVSGVVRAPSPSPQILQLRQRPALPLTKLTLTPGSMAVQKNAPARYISIQQAQQMGLLSGGKITQLVAMSPTKQPVATSTPMVRPIRQNLISSMKSPTKILPAPPQTNSGKVILTGGSQSVVIRPAPSSKPAKQVIKMEGSTGTGTLLASIPAGQKINPQQIHQINIPGKGVQYVRLLPASGLNQNKAASSAAPPSPGGPPATLTLASPSKVTKVSTPQILPKTFLITDFQSNVMQVVPSKGQSSINTSSAPHTSLQKFVGKTQTKHAPVSMNMTSAIQKMNDTPAPLTFTLAPSQSTKAQPMLSKPERVQKLEIEMEEQQEEVIPSPENIKEEMSSSNDMPDQEMVEEEVEDSPLLQSPSSPGPTMEPKHIVMLPASYIHQIQPRAVAANKSMQMTSSVEIKEELSECNSKFESALEFGLRPRKPCNCTKSQCLKLYCDCFANGEFCNQCNCNNCFNNLENEEYRQKAIRSCLDRNPNAFRPKIGKAKNNLGPEVVRRHNKGCNCKRSGCLKNYCECYEGKIACSANCKCVGCRNIEDSLDKKTLRRSRAESVMGIGSDSATEQFSTVSSRNNCNLLTPKNNQAVQRRQPCSIMTSDVIEAVCQCLLAQAADPEGLGGGGAARQVLEEFAHCLQDIISAAQHTKPTQVPSNVL